MAATLTTILIPPPPSISPPLPLFPPPASGTNHTTVQSLAIEVVGVLFAGAGLVLLVLQLRKKYAMPVIDQVAAVELPSNGGEENV